MICPHICWTSWHCIQIYENSKYVGPTKASIRSVLNKSQVRKWGTCIMTADCGDDKDIKKTIQEEKCSWQYAGQEVLICTYWGKKSNCSNHIVTPCMNVLFGVILTITLLEIFVSVIVIHSSVLWTSPDTPARAWYFLYWP